jgi:hypothetical protein
VIDLKHTKVTYQIVDNKVTVSVTLDKFCDDSDKKHVPKVRVNSQDVFEYLQQQQNVDVRSLISGNTIRNLPAGNEQGEFVFFIEKNQKNNSRPARKKQILSKDKVKFVKPKLDTE